MRRIAPSLSALGAGSGQIDGLDNAEVALDWRNAFETHKRCSSVSGTCLPRASEACCQANSSATPRESKVPTATKPARPMLARQCIPTLRSLRSFASRRRHISWAKSSDAGTPRSGIGNLSKSKPAWRTSSASRVSSDPAIPSLGMGSAQNFASIRSMKLRGSPYQNVGAGVASRHGACKDARIWLTASISGGFTRCAPNPTSRARSRSGC